jgi:twitching motility protein PilJ
LCQPNLLKRQLYQEMRASELWDAVSLSRSLEQAFEEFSAAVSAILGDLQALADAKDASRRVVAQHSERLLQATQGLRQAYEQELEESAELPIFLVLGLLQLLLLWQMGRLYLGEDRARRAHAERQADIEQTRNQANLNAILRLMDEMQSFAQGDLRARATVSEDITGAIADTVNYTVEELSILVSRVNQAATQLGQASATAQHTSAELLKAAELQRVEIRTASASVLSMARAINGVSGNAAQSAGVARQSLEAASKGGRAVQDAISGMGQIRDQIQDTAKRIKRLGESSQEIGGIVDLIAGITEQTNVLALNAAIQAASAGEAGRGFSVVAEEVQRLAERSAQATRQIATLVKSIQSDTNGAIAAMEKSTAGVVEGAQLSDAAGQALAEISKVSTRLAELIEDIANTTRSQAAEAGAVATGMEGILAITQQTMQGTEQTARSVGALAQLADGLKSSVSRFQTG